MSENVLDLTLKPKARWCTLVNELTDVDLDGPYPSKSHSEVRSKNVLDLTSVEKVIQV
jgi:hypothetical protein